MDTTTDFYIPVLSIAGSDPSGGAGIQVDIKTCAALGCYGMAAIAGLTAQSPRRVTAVLPTSDFLRQQLTTLLEDIRPAAVKTGMLADGLAVEVTAEAIGRFSLGNVVVDPVMVSTSGHSLAASEAVEAMKKLLLPLATVVTPNVPEAEVLSSLTISSETDAREAARKIASEGRCRAVLVKGGHLTVPVDTLYTASDDTFTTFTTEKVDTPNTHGTGCRLSTAIACGLAKGQPLPEAVGMAKRWLTYELRANANFRFPPTKQ